MIKSVMSMLHIYIKNFKNLINKNNLKIIDYSINEINGGSIEVVVQKIVNINPNL